MVPLIEDWSQISSPIRIHKHRDAVAAGRKGGQAGKGSPAKRRAAQLAAQTRWYRHRKMRSITADPISRSLDASHAKQSLDPGTANASHAKQPGCRDRIIDPSDLQPQ